MKGLTTGQYVKVIQYMIDHMGGKDRISTWHVTEKSLVTLGYFGERTIVPLSQIFAET